MLQDQFWVEKRDLTIYEGPPSGSFLVLGAVEAWKLRMEGYLDDMKWLLCLDYHK